MKKIQFVKFDVFLKVIFTFMFVVGCMGYMHYYVNSDEGVILNGAWKMYHGDTIYKDFFEYVGPASFYVVLAIFKIFAPTYIWTRIISVIMVVVSAFFIFKSSMLIEKNKDVASAAAALWFFAMSYVPLINHNTFSSVSAVVFAYFVLKYLHNRKSLDIFLAGVFSVLTFYFLQTKGVAIFFSFILLLVFIRPLLKKDVLWYVLASAVTFVLGYFLWGDYVIGNLVEMSRQYVAVHKSLYSIVSWPLLLVSIVSFLAIRRYGGNQKMIFLIILQFCLLLASMNQPNATHILMVSFPSIIVLCFLLKDYYLDSEKKIIWQVAMSASIIIFSFLSFFHEGVPFNRAVFDQLAIIQDSLEDKSLYARPFLPGLYFELERENPYYSSTFETELGVPEVLEKNYQIFLEEKPEMIVTNYAMVTKYNYSPNKIDTYIFDNYTKTDIMGNVELWELKK